MKITVSDNKQIKSIFDTESGILYTAYSGIFNAELALNHFHDVEIFSKTQVVKGALADLRKLSGSFNKIIEYLSSEGYPEMKKTGLEAEALVIPNDLIMEHLSEKLAIIIKKKQMKVNIFKSYDEAKTWLIEEVSS